MGIGDTCKYVHKKALGYSTAREQQEKNKIILNVFHVSRKHDTCALLALESRRCIVDTGVNNIEKLNNIFWYKLLEIASVTFE